MVNDYLVTYGEGQASGRYEATRAIVRAYTAEDAAFQALILPKQHAKANAPHAYCYVNAVRPFELGMTFDRDDRTPQPFPKDQAR